MNCAQIEEMLPLYASHDLSERRQQMVTAHLRSCAECSLAADGYHEMQGLMRDLPSPIFGEEVYAEIRQNVWERIERQPQPRAIFESIAAWFRPGYAWASASALMIIVSFVGLYFVVKESNIQPTVVVELPKTRAPEVGPAPEIHGSVPLHPDEGPMKPRQANMPKRQRRPDRMAAPDRGNSLVAYSPDVEAKTIQSSSPIVGIDNPDLAARDPKTLRMEIQTRNPNIRIIWFSQ